MRTALSNKTTELSEKSERYACPQPLHAAQLADALLTIKTASAVCGLSPATLYRKAAAGELRLVRMGKRCTRIRAADLRAFMAACAT
ncbi:MAG: hypothetical protein RLY71_3790 [Pseudomonadota bacterium]|jgi:excisionase family DNA binding protein